MNLEAVAIAREQAALLERMRELAKTVPHDVDALVCHLVAHLRSWRPESVAPLGVLPAPGEIIRDPRASK